MKSKHILIFGVVLAFVIGISLSSVNAISPFTEIGNLEMETLAAINDIIIELTAQTERIDALNATEISEQIEQDGMQDDITALQADFDTVMIEVDSIMVSLNTVIRDHSAAFNNGFGQNGTVTSVVKHKAFVNTNVTVTYEYLESLRNFNNGTARSFQLADDVLLLGDSKIFLDTYIVPLGVIFEGTIGFVDGCLILPTEDPNICSRTTSLVPGEELRVVFKTDLGGTLTGMTVNQITTRITTVITP